MKLHIVTHCYAIELNQYASFLHYQLSSIVLYPPQEQIVIEVCCTSSDQATMDVLKWFVGNTGARIKIRDMQPPERLFRRSIGRNESALSSDADLIWFTDCDYLFGPGCIDGLFSVWDKLDKSVSMLWPRHVFASENHKDGDRLVEQDLNQVYDIPFDLFKRKRESRALGGIQIVPGSLARSIGYLKNFQKYQKPRSHFDVFSDDVAFRKNCLLHGPIVPVEFSGLYRLRHSTSSYAKGICPRRMKK